MDIGAVCDVVILHVSHPAFLFCFFSWPMLMCITYPLILAVSLWAFHVGILPGKKPFIVVIGWLTITIGLIVALAFTGCRDPGILYRHARPPPQVRIDELVASWLESCDSFLDVSHAVLLSLFFCVISHVVCIMTEFWLQTTGRK